jgi:hypothetical protein
MSGRREVEGQPLAVRVVQARTVSGTVLTLPLPVHHALYPGCPFGLIQRGVKIKAGKKSATCAASPRKSSKLAPSLRSVAQTAKIFVRSDSAPVEPPISSRPVVSGPGGGAERIRHSTAWVRMDVLRLTPHRERPGTSRGPGCSIDWSGANARAPSPFSRGRRTGRGDGMGPLHLAPFPFYPSFSPLSRGETRGRASCFARREGVPLSRDGRAQVPSLEREGQGG